jgi:hypothetical protein
MIACGTLAVHGSAGAAALGPLATAPTSGAEAPLTCMTAPHTEHRARTPPAGTFAGSTRKTD